MIFAVVDFHPPAEGKRAFYDPVGIAFFVRANTSTVAVTAFHNLDYDVKKDSLVNLLLLKDLPESQIQLPTVVKLAHFNPKEDWAVLHLVSSPYEIIPFEICENVEDQVIETLDQWIEIQVFS